MIGVFCRSMASCFTCSGRRCLSPCLIVGYGWTQSGLCGNQVFPLHPDRVATHAGGTPLPLSGFGGSFDLLAFHHLPLTGGAQTLVFLAFFAAFAVKIPMVPVHTRLPDAHVEAPTGSSVILAAITLKMGAYGFLQLPCRSRRMRRTNSRPWLLACPCWRSSMLWSRCSAGREENIASFDLSHGFCHPRILRF